MKWVAFLAVFLTARLFFSAVARSIRYLVAAFPGLIFTCSPT